MYRLCHLGHQLHDERDRVLRAAQEHTLRQLCRHTVVLQHAFICNLSLGLVTHHFLPGWDIVISTTNGREKRDNEPIMRV